MSTRIIGGILVEVVIFVFTVVLAMLDSSQWPGAFFWTTMGSVVILNSKLIEDEKNLMQMHVQLFFCNISGWWYIPEHCIWYGGQVALQIHRSSRPWICK